MNINELARSYNLTTNQRIKNQIASKVFDMNRGFYAKSAMYLPNYAKHWEDFHQYAKLFTIKALETYDVHKASFVTHHIWWLRAAVTRFTSKEINLIKPNPHGYMRKRKAEREGREIDPKDWPVCFPVNNFSFSCLPDVDFEDSDSRIKIKEIAKALNENEMDILSERFGLKSGIPKTLQEIAYSKGLSRERIRQIQKIIFKKIKAHVRNHYENPICSEIKKEYIDNKRG